MNRHLAPAGAPIGIDDLSRWTWRGVRDADPARTLRRTIEQRFRVSRVVPVASGRVGLTLTLRAMTRLAGNERREVVLPSYTCFSVPAAIVKAGLIPRIVDIAPETLDFDREALARTDFSRVLAIVATNLYGLPNDMPALAALARRHGVFLIDDAAQAMGATVGGRASGTWGDAGIFSFDKGKNVSAIKGGVVVAGSGAMAEAVAAEAAGLGAPGLSESVSVVLKAVASFVFLRPSLYGIPKRIPQLGLGATIYSTGFPLTQPSRSSLRLADIMMRRLDMFTEARRARALAILDGLESIPGVRPISSPDGARPVYLRLPVLFNHAAARQRVHAALLAEGIGASESYPSSIADIPDLRDILLGGDREAQGARHVARHLLTLPTHPLVTAPDIARMLAVVANNNGGAAGPATTVRAEDVICAE